MSFFEKFEMSTMMLIGTDILKYWQYLSEEALYEIAAAIENDPLKGNRNWCLAGIMKDSYSAESTARFIDVMCDESFVYKIQIGTIVNGTKHAIVDKSIRLIDEKFLEKT